METWRADRRDGPEWCVNYGVEIPAAPLEDTGDAMADGSAASDG